jgi:hypothetical protein
LLTEMLTINYRRLLAYPLRRDMGRTARHPYI